MSQRHQQQPRHPTQQAMSPRPKRKQLSHILQSLRRQRRSLWTMSQIRRTRVRDQCPSTPKRARHDLHTSTWYLNSFPMRANHSGSMSFDQGPSTSQSSSLITEHFSQACNRNHHNGTIRSSPEDRGLGACRCHFLKQL